MTPAGEINIERIRIAPKIINLYDEMNLKISGIDTRTVVPSRAPAVEPRPPKTIAARNKRDRLNPKLSGMTNCKYEA